MCDQDEGVHWRTWKDRPVDSRTGQEEQSMGREGQMYHYVTRQRDSRIFLQSFFFQFFADAIQSHHLIPPQRRWQGEKFVIIPITYEFKTKNKIIHFLSPLFNYIYLPATCIIIECLTWKKKHRQFWNVMKVTVDVCLLFLVSFPVFDFDLTEIEILCCHLCAPL